METKKFIGSSPALANMKALQDTHQRGKKSAGQLITMAAGRTEIRVPVTGTARFLLGFKVIPAAKSSGGASSVADLLTAQISVVLNNDIIVSGGALLHYSLLNIHNGEYFAYLRPLTGADVLTVSLVNPTADTFSLVFQYYYVDKA